MHPNDMPINSTRDLLPNTDAQWNIELLTQCPHCKKDIDLMDEPYEIHEYGVGVGEHDTLRSSALEINCEHCEKDFSVDLVY